jgi:hypothetical protein
MRMSLGCPQPNSGGLLSPRTVYLVSWSRLVSVLMGGMLACDGYIQVDGHVYTRPSSEVNGTSTVYLDDSLPDTAGLVALDSAAVWLFHRPSDTALVGPGPLPLWVSVDTTDRQGRFSVYSTTGPRPFTALLRIRRPGYHGVDAPFYHVASAHRAIVVLVRTAGTAP